MSLWQAIAFFFKEAFQSILRGWKVSLLAVLTIAVSLFVGGGFLIVTKNLSRQIGDWRRDAKIVLYLEPGVPPEDAPEVVSAVRAAGWVRNIQTTTAEQARERFHATFPSLGDLVEVWSDEPLPASIELSLGELPVDSSNLDQWIASLEALPKVAGIDDDRDWLRQIEIAVRVLTGLGITLGAVLLGAAVFTIGSVIRLTAYLHRDAIAIMRLVGATEFFIRGPFYVEGLLQGLIGGGMALGGLYLGHWLVAPDAPGAVVAAGLLGEFLGVRQQLFLLQVGGLAGLLGAITSLRREVVASEAGG